MKQNLVTVFSRMDTVGVVKSPVFNVSSGDNVVSVMNFLFGVTALSAPPVACTTNAVNSLAPGKFGCNSKGVIFKCILLTGIFSISSEIGKTWMLQNTYK